MKSIPVWLPVLIMSAALFSCKNNPSTGKKQETIPVQDTAHFYPLNVYFKEEMEYVDLRAFPIYRITTKDGKKDSIPVSKEEFLSLAQTFLRYDIAAPEVKALYKESSFEDLSTGSLTLNYKPIEKNAVVQNIDVLMDQEGRGVKRVFIRAVYSKGDTTVTEQCSWKTGKSFRINRSKDAPGYTSTELTFVNWNDTP